jgi:tetratricopeptide (TPR) repeat protein
MISTRTGLRLGLVVAALALLTGLARAADDKALRERLLALNQVTGDDPMAGAILTLIEDKAGTPKLLALAVKMAKEKDPPFNYNAAYILARSAEQLKDLDSAVPLYRLSIDLAKKLMSPTRLFQSYSGLIAGYYAAEKYDESKKACQEFLEIPQEPVAGGDDFETPKYNATLRRGQELIRRELVQILTRQGKTDEANKIIENMLKLDPDDMDALELRALIQRESGDYAAAAKTFEEMIQRVNDAIESIKKNKDASKEAKEAFIKQFSADVRDYRYSLSSLYIDARDVKKAAEQLQILLKEEPDNPGYNNDLGYVWADHDMNLDEAEKLIRKAIDGDKANKAKKDPALKPDEVRANSAYLDSLGWVLYKRKKYKEALPPLLDAVKDKEGQHIEIFDHLAEVHMALGDKAAALDAWKKGVEKAGPSKREKEKKVEVEKKIKANQ